MSLDDLFININLSNCSIPLNEEDGIFLGNGKIGIITSIKHNIDVTRVVQSQSLYHSYGILQPNVVDTFNTYKWNIFVDGSNNMICKEISMLMETGSYSSLHLVKGVDISNKLYVFRHLPFSTLQTVELDVTAIEGSNIELFHEVSSSSNMTNTTYDHSFININGKRIYQVYGSSLAQNGLQVGFASSYLLEGIDESCVYGFLTSAFKPRNCLYKFRIDSTNLDGNVIKLHCITTTFTKQDADDPVAEARITTTNLATARPLASTTITLHLTKHVSAWSQFWESRIKIFPKQGISDESHTSIQKLNKLINVAFYNIYSSFSADAIINTSSDVNYIDFEGNIIYDGDLWLVPLLILFKPKLAKGILELRWKRIEEAQRLAAAYGLDGAKIPYIDDNVGFKNNLYIKTTGLNYYFNSALVIINAWNYYRVTRDKDWFYSKGHKLIRYIAVYLIESAIYDDSNDEYYYKDTSSLNGTVSMDRNSFNAYLCKTAIKYAIESCYDVKEAVPSSWYQVLEGINILRYPSTYGEINVSQFDSTSTKDDTYDKLETLFMFLPQYWDDEQSRDKVSFARIIQNNYNFYMERINEAWLDNPTNIALIAILASISRLVDAPSGAVFNTSFQRFIDNNVYGPWYNMKQDERIIPTVNITDYVLRKQLIASYGGHGNSIISNAIFLSILVQGIGQIRIVGGLGETRLPYADFKISSEFTAPMNDTWSMVSFTKLGFNGSLKTFDIRPMNTVIDSSFASSNLPSSSYHYNFNIYTP